MVDESNAELYNITLTEEKEKRCDYEIHETIWNYFGSHVPRRGVKVCHSASDPGKHLRAASITVRKSPDSRTDPVYTANKGVVLDLIEANAAPGWHKVNTASGAGYIPVRYSALIFQGSGEQFDEPTGLEGSLSYYGAAIKLTGDYGIRVRFGIDIAAHDGGTIAGYTIKEYGVIADGEKQRAYYTENGAKYDKVSAVADGMALFAANIDNIAALKAEHSFVPYIIAENAKGEITHYGDEVKLSVYSVAIKLADEYAADSAEGQYIAALIAQANAE